MTEQNSGILGIRNRTENWKTARSFGPFFRVNRHILADRLCGKAIHGAGDVHLELFWKGMRDYVHHHNPDRETLAEELGNLYNSLFPDLRGQIEIFGRFQLNPDNYRVISVEQRRKMATNIRNTEVDIILETPSHLFVGEAKHEMSFGADGNLVLVHQLIRQYVLSQILVELCGGSGVKSVIPFVIGDNIDGIKKTAQVQFMIEQGWLKADNILGWDEIESIAFSAGNY